MRPMIKQYRFEYFIENHNDFVLLIAHVPLWTGNYRIATLITTNE